MRILTSITIAAPREAVWRTFVAVDYWRQWSPWNLRFPHQPRFEQGVRFFVTASAPFLSFIKLTYPCQVSALEDSKWICWSGRVFGVPGYHQFTMEDTADGCCVLSEERFKGPLAPLLRPVKGLIQANVIEFLSRLRGAAEATAP